MSCSSGNESGETDYNKGLYSDNQTTGADNVQLSSSDTVQIQRSDTVQMQSIDTVHLKTFDTVQMKSIDTVHMKSDSTVRMASTDTLNMPRSETVHMTDSDVFYPQRSETIQMTDSKTYTLKCMECFTLHWRVPNPEKVQYYRVYQVMGPSDDLKLLGLTIFQCFKVTGFKLPIVDVSKSGTELNVVGGNSTIVNTHTEVKFECVVQPVLNTGNAVPLTMCKSNIKSESFGLEKIVPF